MQAQYAVPSHSDYYTSQPLLQDPYLTSNDAQNLTNGFSRGSSLAYQHPNYPYLLDRGELTSRLCSSSLVVSTLDATGLGFAGNTLINTTFAAPEDIVAYDQQAWDWIGAPEGEIIAPSPIYAPQPAENVYFGISSADHASVVRSPAPQLPTPAAMAILLNPSDRSEAEPSETGYQLPVTSALIVNRPSATTKHNRLVEQVVANQEGILESLSREKKHACTMCHKRFDRPSTLRKHLLVHTGEKAFVCDTCGRRFGVASNLNRHVKRCVLKPVNTPSPSKSTPESPSEAMDSPNTSTPAASSVILSSTESYTSLELRGGRNTQPSSLSSPSRGSCFPTYSIGINESSRVSITPTAKTAKLPGQKRRRRAPSPSQWVPPTLQNLKLVSEDSLRATSVPLPPVRRSFPKEERDSWDENVGVKPYHPVAWTGTLPGPGLGHGIGLGGKDLGSMELGGRGGVVLGRVLVC